MKCPNGHDSAETDYCDVCGAAMEAGSGATADPGPEEAAAPESAEAAPGRPCPNCGTPGLPDALFCEACGYDWTTGTMPRAVGNALDLDSPTPATEADAPEAPEPAASEPDGEPEDPTTGIPVVTAPTGAPDNPAPTLEGLWVAEVWIDPAWYRDQSSPDPLPSAGPPDVVRLRRTSLLIGRASASRGITPDIDCGMDNGVSRRHAQLTSDGSRWWVEDLDSSNGTWIGDTVGALPTKAIPPRTKREIASDDRIYVGSWTRIVIRSASQDEIDALG